MPKIMAPTTPDKSKPSEMKATPEGLNPNGSNMFDIRDPTARNEPNGRLKAIRSNVKFLLSRRSAQVSAHPICLGTTSETADGGLSGLSLITNINITVKMIVTTNYTSMRSRKAYRNALESPSGTLENHPPTNPNEIPVPRGLATSWTAVARALSLSVNHRLAMIS